MLQADRREGLVQGRRGVSGFWPANSVGDDIQLFGDASRGKPIATLHTLRQQLARARGPCQRGAGRFRRAGRLADHIGAFVVTAGIGEDEVADRFKNANDDYSSIMVKALADRLAEAFAERLHQTRAQGVLGLCAPTRRWATPT